MALDKEVEEILKSIRERNVEDLRKTTPIKLPDREPEKETAEQEEEPEPPAEPVIPQPEPITPEPIIQEPVKPKPAEPEPVIPAQTEKEIEPQRYIKPEHRPIDFDSLMPEAQKKEKKPLPPPVHYNEPEHEEKPFEKARGELETRRKPNGKLKLTVDSKKLPVIIGVTLLAAILVAGIVFLSQNAYLIKYKAKYHISFPKGIPQEFCDYYGNNQSFAGTIIIEDNNSETPIYSKPKDGEALFEKGSSVNEDQHYRAAAISVTDADLEALYKDAESFVSSTQSFTFKTVNGNREKYQVIAAYIVNTDPADDKGYAFPYNCYGNFTENSYDHYQDTIKCRSLYNTGYKIAQEDYCMSLSVPTDIMPGFRFVIVGVKRTLVNRIEKVTENKNIRYPQAYCDKLGIHNIYGFAYKWFPEIVNPQTGETKQLTAEDFK